MTQSEREMGTPSADGRPVRTGRKSSVRPRGYPDRVMVAPSSSPKSRADAHLPPPVEGPGAPLAALDLFCGCGGLGLGFELLDKPVRYEIVLAIDNSRPALGCFNANHVRPEGTVTTGRLCDVTWFKHPTEVLLYYMIHLALWRPEPSLLSAMDGREGRLRSFLGTLRQLDASLDEQLAKLGESTDYSTGLERVEGLVFNLAITKAFLGRLGLASLRRPSLSAASTPWREEYIHPALARPAMAAAQLPAPLPELAQAAETTWSAEVGRLEEASGKAGRGQHVVVGPRVRRLVDFLKSKPGVELGRRWIAWRALRDSARARFCEEIESDLRHLYSGERRVRLVLGGPPCKGFSRIGRAVIESLRDQGAHAWASVEYGDERNALLHKYVLFLEALRPDVFLFENVAHFASSLRTPNGTLDAAGMLEQSINDLSANRLRFHVASTIVRAKDFAVPQARERFILVGCNEETTAPGVAESILDLPTSPEEVPLNLALQGLGAPVEFAFDDARTEGAEALVPAYTLLDPRMPPSHQEFVRWIRQPIPGRASPPGMTDAHVVRRPRPDDRALMLKLAPGQRWMDYKLKSSKTLSDLRSSLDAVIKFARTNVNAELPLADLVSLRKRADGGLLLRLLLEEIYPPHEFGEEHHLLTGGYLSNGDDQHGDWLERLSASRPCKTVVAHIGKDTYGYIHPYEPRALSMREAARVQTFPDFYLFGTAGIVDGYSMIGNAVPPLLAYKLAARIAAVHSPGASAPVLGVERRNEHGRRGVKSTQMTLGLGGAPIPS